MRFWIGRLLLWYWRRRRRVTRSESTEVQTLERKRLAAPPELVAVFDTGDRFVAVFDVGLPEHWFVFRFTAYDSASQIVHRALLNVHEPHGRVDFARLSTSLQRDVIEAYSHYADHGGQRTA